MHHTSLIANKTSSILEQRDKKEEEHCCLNIELIYTTIHIVNMTDLLQASHHVFGGKCRLVLFFLLAETLRECYGADVHCGNKTVSCLTFSNTQSTSSIHGRIVSGWCFVMKHWLHLIWVQNQFPMVLASPDSTARTLPNLYILSNTEIHA